MKQGTINDNVFLYDIFQNSKKLPVNDSCTSTLNSTSTKASVPSDSEFRQAYDQWKNMQLNPKQPASHMRRSPLSPLTEMEKEVNIHDIYDIYVV